MKGEQVREKHQFVVPLISAFTGWFLYVAWLGIKPATLVYQDDTLTRPGLSWPILVKHKLHATPLCFSLCTSTAPSHFSVTEYSRNLATEMVTLCYIALWPLIFFAWIPHLMNNVRNLCFAHLCIHQQPPPSRVVHSEH